MIILLSHLLSTLISPSQQFRQRGQTTSVAEEGVFQQFLRAGPTLDLHTQTDGQKFLQLLAQLVRVLQARGAVGGDEEEGLEGLLVQVRGFGFDHLNGHDAQGPDVYFGSVFFLLHHLRCHPVGCPHHRGPFGFGFGQFRTEAEVGCSHQGVSLTVLMVIVGRQR